MKSFIGLLLVGFSLSFSSMACTTEDTFPQIEHCYTLQAFEPHLAVATVSVPVIMDTMIQIVPTDYLTSVILVDHLMIPTCYPKHLSSETQSKESTAQNTLYNNRRTDRAREKLIRGSYQS